MQECIFACDDWKNLGKKNLYFETTLACVACVKSASLCTMSHQTTSCLLLLLSICQSKAKKLKCKFTLWEYVCYCTWVPVEEGLATSPSDLSSRLFTLMPSITPPSPGSVFSYKATHTSFSVASVCTIPVCLWQWVTFMQVKILILLITETASVSCSLPHPSSPRCQWQKVHWFWTAVIAL